MKTFSIIKKIILPCLMILYLTLIEIIPVISEEKFGQKAGLSKSSINNSIAHTQINVGNIVMWIWADGRMAINPDGEAGAFYPRGTANIIFQDGIIWGGLVRDGMDPLIRVGGQQYNSGTQPGKIIARGVAENPADPDVNRIWRIRRDLSDSRLMQEVADLTGKPLSEVSYEEAQTLREQYIKDWREWPWQKGAPFYDADEDGVYTPYINDYGNYYHDEPGLAEADQVVWFVCNDLDTALANNLMGSPPIGLEVQVTLWSYEPSWRHPGLENCIFKQVRIIYKGTEDNSTDARIDSMYLAQWSDPDLGYDGDDFVGCDTLLNLGFVYNSSFSDIEFEKYHLLPPAAGYNILAGPIVPVERSTAIFNFKRISGFRNLPMTTFTFFASSMNDPDWGRIYDATLQWWNIFRGFRYIPTAPPESYVNPFTGAITKFRVPGDPVTGVGWIDANPGDRRMILSSGPFNLALGDTNEITIALVAGLGGDRLLSVSVMKYYDRIAQAAFNNLFEFPEEPPAPAVSASEMDGQIILNWSASQEQVETIEQWEDSGHKFEGYNIYQLPSRYSWPKSEWLKLATYDRKNEVGSIIQEEFDPESGAVLTKAVQVGTNSGIVRSQHIIRDELNYRPLINGKEYYFAVTSYSYNPDRNDPLKSLESDATIVTVVPKSLKLGERLQATVGDTIFAQHTAGFGDGKVVALVTDPTDLTGDDYRVEFYQNISGNLLWRLFNITTGEMLLKDQTNQSGDENYLITEGFLLKVIDVQQDFKDFQTVANANGPIDPVGAAADWSNPPAGFPGMGRPPVGQQATNNSLWLIHTGDTDRPTRFRYSDFVYRTTQNQTLWNVIIPYDFEIRFTAAGGFGLVPGAFIAGDNFGGMVIPVPFELWRIGEARENDRSDDVRMIPYLFDNLGDGIFNFTGLDHAVSDDDDDPYTDWIYWQMPIDETPGDAGYQAFVTRITTDLASYGYRSDCYDVMRRMVLVAWNGGTVSGTFFEASIPEAGTIFRIITTKPNTPIDVFTFSTADYRIIFDTELAKQDAAMINVYPNPYYGIFTDNSSASDQYVTFSHLPQQAVIRIFTLAGVLVKTIIKDDQSSLLRWYLNNEKGRLVASGIYIVHLELPAVGMNKILKLVIVHK